MRQLEKSPPTMKLSVDKSQIVIGGCEDLDGEEAEKLVSDVLGRPHLESESNHRNCSIHKCCQCYENSSRAKVQPKDARTQIVGIRKPNARRAQEMQNRQQNQAGLD